jgi:hypothetical protein
MIPTERTAPSIVWSELLGDHLVVTKVDGDTWEFVPLKWVQKLVPMKAVVPLDSMPLGPP